MLIISTIRLDLLFTINRDLGQYLCDCWIFVCFKDFLNDNFFVLLFIHELLIYQYD